MQITSWELCKLLKSFACSTHNKKPFLKAVQKSSSRAVPPEERQAAALALCVGLHSHGGTVWGTQEPELRGLAVSLAGWCHRGVTNSFMAALDILPAVPALAELLPAGQAPCLGQVVVVQGASSAGAGCHCLCQGGGFCFVV